MQLSAVSPVSQFAPLGISTATTVPETAETYLKRERSDGFSSPENPYPNIASTIISAVFSRIETLSGLVSKNIISGFKAESL